jgi:YggT family protein
MASFIFFIIDSLLGLLLFVIFATVVFSWLVAFDVVNYRNNFVRQVGQFLDAVSRPILRPFQKILPSFGGVDISPILAGLIIIGIRAYLLPMARAALQPILG